MLQLPQRLSLDLPNPLPRHGELLPNLLERVIRIHPDRQPHPDHM
jgi:hypothetical protein